MSLITTENWDYKKVIMNWGLCLTLNESEKIWNFPKDLQRLKIYPSYRRKKKKEKLQEDKFSVKPK